MPYRNDRDLAQEVSREKHFQDGPAQMKHFTSLGLNIFRLPVGWQFLVAHKLGGKLEPRNFAFYNELVQECLKTGSHCIVDIHNYGRWDNMIVGQDPLLPTKYFANLWGELAKKYAKEPRVMMGLMNEPHHRRPRHVDEFIN
jgi:endoglucanase